MDELHSILISGLLWQFNHQRFTECSHCSSNCECQSTRICRIVNGLDAKFTSIKYLQRIDNIHIQCAYTLYMVVS